MADSAPLMFKKHLGMLAPSNQAASEALAAISGEVRVVIKSTKGNNKRNALYWVMLGIAAPQLTERMDGDALTVNLLHRVLKKKYGIIRTIKLPSGDTIESNGSTSFDKMPENERAEYIGWAIDTLEKWLGVAPGELRNAA